MNKKDDAVFSGGGADWHNRAQLMHELTTRGFGNRWWLYGTGYKEAADRLVAGVNDGQGQQDFLIYPVLYLYRHYLEVMIKGQVREAQKALCVEPPAKPKTKQERIEAGLGHDLLALWGHLLELVYRIHPELDSDLMTEATRVVAAFAEHDAGGDAFRYPETIERKSTLTSIHEINLRRLRDDMDRACAALTQIEGVLDYEQEMNQLAYEYLGEFDHGY